MKLLLGFAAGVALTSLSFVFWDWSAMRLPAEQSNATTPLSSSESDSARDLSPAREALTPADPASSDRSFEAISDGIGLPDELTRLAMSNRSRDEERDIMLGWSDEELIAVAELARGTVESEEVLQAQRVLAMVIRELERRRLVADRANSPPDNPIYLPPEFDQLLESTVVLNNHEQLQREPVDPAWSSPMEANFQEFFESRPEIAEKFGTPTITCRTSGCEITLLAYGIDVAGLASEHEIPDSTPAEAVSYDFGVAIRGWREQPWARDFLTVYPPNIRVENGATTIYWPLRR